MFSFFKRRSWQDQDRKPKPTANEETYKELSCFNFCYCRGKIIPGSSWLSLQKAGQGKWIAQKEKIVGEVKVRSSVCSKRPCKHRLRARVCHLLLRRRPVSCQFWAKRQYKTGGPLKT